MMQIEKRKSFLMLSLSQFCLNWRGRVSYVETKSEQFYYPFQKYTDKRGIYLVIMSGCRYKSILKSFLPTPFLRNSDHR